MDSIAAPEDRRVAFAPDLGEPTEPLEADPRSLIPLGNLVLVVPNEAPATTAGGVVLPDKVKVRPVQGVVVAVGDDVSLNVQVGDEVLYGRFVGVEVTWNETVYIGLAESDVLAIIGMPDEYKARFDVKDTVDA